MLLKDQIKSVVNSLRLFEKGFTSVKRNPVDMPTRIGSLSEFVECRLNFELFKLDNFREMEGMMDGHLFKVTKMEGERFRGYDRIYFELGDRPEWVNEEDYESLREAISILLGGVKMSFTSDRRNLEIIVE